MLVDRNGPTTFEFFSSYLILTANFLFIVIRLISHFA